MAGFDYTYNDIIASLKRIGIEQGDTLFIHSNIGFFGRMENVKKADDLCEGFLNALLETVGKEGTVVVPTFSYSFCHNEIYNAKTTRTSCGMLSEYIRKQEGVLRSNDPNFSIAAIGKLALHYTQNPAHESFGVGSFWQRFLEKNGKILCMNMDCGSTFVHYIEHMNQVSYRYNKSFNGVYVDESGKEVRDYFVHYVYDLEKPEDGPYFVRLDKKCHADEICKTVSLGKGTMLVMNSVQYADYITKTLKTEPRFLTVGGDIFEK